MAKITGKEKKQKKEIAKQIMDFYGINYNDWLHEQHELYIEEHLMNYMKEQANQQKDLESGITGNHAKNDNEDSDLNSYN